MNISKNLTLPNQHAQTTEKTQNNPQARSFFHNSTTTYTRTNKHTQHIHPLSLCPDLQKKTLSALPEKKEEKEMPLDIRLSLRKLDKYDDFEYLKKRARYRRIAKKMEKLKARQRLKAGYDSVPCKVKY
jgi:hypothetical protein